MWINDQCLLNGAAATARPGQSVADRFRQATQCVIIAALLALVGTLISGASPARGSWSVSTDGLGTLTVAPDGSTLLTDCFNPNSRASFLDSVGREVWDLGGFLEPGEEATTGFECRPTLVDEHGTAYLAAYDGAGYSLEAVERDGTSRWIARLGSYLDPIQAGHTLARSGDALYFLDGSARGSRLRGLSMDTGEVVLDEGLPHDLPRAAHTGTYRSGDSVGYVTTQGSAWLNLRTRAWRVRHRELPADEHWWRGPLSFEPAPGGQVVGVWGSSGDFRAQWHVEVEDASGSLWSFTSPVGEYHGLASSYLKALPTLDGDVIVYGGNARTGDIGEWLSRVRPDGSVAWVRSTNSADVELWEPGGTVRIDTSGTVVFTRQVICDEDRYPHERCTAVYFRSGLDGAVVYPRLLVRPSRSNGFTHPHDLRLAPGRILVTVSDDARAPYGGYVHSIDTSGLAGELATDLLTDVESARPRAWERMWVALGDSYSAGEGVPRFDAGTDVGAPVENRCHRSGSAYGRVAAGHLAGAEITLANGRKQRLLGYPVHVACSGAIAADLVSPFAENHTPAINRDEGAQIDAISRQATKVVTLTIGGNDAGFADVLKNCLALGVGQGLLSRGSSFFNEPSVTCKRLFAKQVRDRIELLRGRLQNTLWFVKRRAHPDARVLVLAYPQIFPSSPPAQCWGIARGDVTWMHAEQAHMNRVLREEAGAAGVEFVDTESVTAGRDTCQLDPARRWIHGPYIDSLNPLENIEYSFHPTEAGQAAMARVVEQRLQEPPPGAQAQGLGDGVTRRLQVDVGPTVGVAGSDARHSGSTPSGSRSGVAATRADSAGATPTEASFVVSWSIGNLQTTLTDPSGRTYTAATDGVEGERADGLERLTIPNGEPGTWTVELASEQTDGNEADVTVTSSLAQAEDPPPSAVYETSASGARVGEAIGFDASSSFGSEPITSWSWDFGDGTSGAGEQARHAYATPGSYQPTLTVRTASGASDTFTGPAVVVKGGPSAPPPQPGSSPAEIGSVSTPATGGLVPSPLRPITTTRVTVRTQAVTVRLRRSDCSRQRLRISGTGVSIAKVKRLRSGRCRLTLRVRSDARTGTRRLLIKRGTRTVRTRTRITIRPARRAPTPARVVTASGRGSSATDAGSGGGRLP